MIDDLLSKLEKVRGGRGRWTACCPAHGDKNPSLAIRLTDDDRILLKCFAGCSAAEVVESVGMSLSDLFPEDGMRTIAGKSERRPFSASDLLRIVEFEALVVSLCAKDMAAGKMLSNSDQGRLKTAHQRILEVVNFIK